MKLTDITPFKSHQERWGAWVAIFAVAAVLGSGCSKAPEAQTADESQKLSQQQLDRRIQSIQNDPTKSADAKQKAIAILNSQKAASQPK